MKRRFLPLLLASVAVVALAPTAFAQEGQSQSPPAVSQPLVAPGTIPAENIDGSKVNRGTQNETLKIVARYNKAIETGNNEAMAVAVSDLAALNKKDPKNMSAITWLGYMYTKSGDFMSAAPLLEPALGKSQSDQINKINATNLGACYYLSGQYVKAQPVLAMITELEPDNAEAWALQGSAAVLTQNYEGGIAPLMKARALHSENRAARQSVNVDLALALTKTGKMNEAFDVFGDMRAIGDLSATQLAWMGYVYLDSGKVDDAIVVLEESRKLDSNDPAVVNNLASAYLKRGADGDRTKARTMFVELVRLVPENGTAAYNAGAMYLEEGKFAEAKTYLSRAVNNSSDPFALNNLGRAYEGLGKTADAASNYAKASDMREDNVMFAKNAGVTYNRLGDDAMTIKYLGRAMANGEQSADVLVNLAAAYTRIGQTEKAAEIMKTPVVAESMSGNADYWFNQGVAAQKAGRTTEAKAAYEKALAIKPDDIDALNNLGVLLFDSGDYDESLTVFQKLSGMESGSINAKLNMAACLSKMGRLDDAIEIWKGVVRAEGGRNDVRLDLADALWNVGDTPGARYHYATVLKSDANNFRALNGMGLWSLLQSDNKSAASYFEKSKNAKKDFTVAYHNLAVAYERLNRIADAKATLNALLKVDPENEDAKKMLSRLNSLG